MAKNLGRLHANWWCASPWFRVRLHRDQWNITLAIGPLDICWARRRRE